MAAMTNTQTFLPSGGADQAGRESGWREMRLRVPGLIQVAEGPVQDAGRVGRIHAADGTGAAGQCLLFEATRNGYSVIGVTLHSPGSIGDLNRADATRILNWAFSLRS